MARSLLAVLIIAGSMSELACGQSGGSAQSVLPASTGRIAVDVTADGFMPAQTKLKVGQPVTLVITRKTGQTCATDIVIKDYGIQKALPENEPVEVTFTPTKPGRVRYACAMDMVAGEFVVE